MELKEILNSIKQTQRDGIEKTAAVTPPPVKGAKQKLEKSLQKSLAPAATTAGATKTSTVKTSAVDELVKIAGDLANSESEALQKEAHLYGAAVCDGFMSRLNQYELAAANTPATKTASASDFEKFAAENPELVKQAVELGYRDGQNQIEQLKVAAFEKGYKDTVAQINELSKTAEGQAVLSKTAAQVQEQTGIAAQLEKLAETPEGRVKLAEVKRGYDDTMNELTKMAGDTFDRGYNDTIKVLRAM